MNRSSALWIKRAQSIEAAQHGFHVGRKERLLEIGNALRAGPRCDRPSCADVISTKAG
jgi:hypothetical protein